MKIKDLIEALKDYNEEAKVDVIVNCYPVDWSICFGSSEGCTKANCDSVSFYVESPNCQERPHSV